METEPLKYFNVIILLVIKIILFPWIVFVDAYLEDGERDVVLDVPVRRDDRDRHRHDLGHEPELLASSGRVELHTQSVRSKNIFIIIYYYLYLSFVV